MLSRVADSLYWLARYIERAEHTTRLIAVKLESMVEQTPDEAEASWHRVAGSLSSEEFSKASDAHAMTHALAFERRNASSLLVSLTMARDNARQVREQLSTEFWEILNRLYLRLQPVTIQAIWVHQPARVFREALEDFQALEGVTNSTLSHGEGWYFLELGRYSERAQLISRLLDVHFRTGFASQPKYFDWLVLLKFCTAFEPYTRFYTAAVRPEKVAEFLLFGGDFPHSVRFAVERMCDALARVASGAPQTRRAPVERIAGRLKAAVEFGQISELIRSGGLAAFLGDIAGQCEDIHDAVYSSYISYGAEAVT